MSTKDYNSFDWVKKTQGVLGKKNLRVGGKDSRKVKERHPNALGKDSQTSRGKSPKHVRRIHQNKLRKDSQTNRGKTHKQVVERVLDES